MRLFGRLSSVTALALSVLLLQPTASMADYVTEDWGQQKRWGIHCAALYTIATAAYPNDEGRKQKLFRSQTLFKQVFAAKHGGRRKQFDGSWGGPKRFTMGHLIKDVSYTVTRLGKKYAAEPHSLVSLLGHCQRFEKVLLKERPDLTSSFEILLAYYKIDDPPPYSESAFRKSKRIVDRWFKAWTKMGRPTPQSMREDFKRKLRVD